MVRGVFAAPAQPSNSHYSSQTCISFTIPDHIIANFTRCQLKMNGKTGRELKYTVVVRFAILQVGKRNVVKRYRDLHSVPMVRHIHINKSCRILGEMVPRSTEDRILGGQPHKERLRIYRILGLQLPLLLSLRKMASFNTSLRNESTSPG